MKNRIGFVGLGQMGKWMAINLLRAGFDLTVFDIDRQALNLLQLCLDFVHKHIDDYSTGNQINWFYFYSLN